MSEEQLQKVSKLLVGKTIIGVRLMSRKEAKELNWIKRPIIIFFSDNSYIFSTSDNDGSNGGAYFTSDENLSIIQASWF